MHIFFPVARQRAGATDDAGVAESAADAGLMQIVRDPEDASEWQYLGNPQIAATTSLTEVVARFIQDCSGADGVIDQEHAGAAKKLRDALLSCAQQINDALRGTGTR